MAPLPAAPRSRSSHRRRRAAALTAAWRSAAATLRWRVSPLASNFANRFTFALRDVLIACSPAATRHCRRNRRAYARTSARCATCTCRGITLAGAPVVSRVIKGLLNTFYVRVHGTDALISTRKEPITNHYTAIYRIGCTAPVRVGRHTVPWRLPRYRYFKAVLIDNRPCRARAGAARKRAVPSPWLSAGGKNSPHPPHPEFYC